jgi:uncharacterized coiled-coil DUF342 family protein
MGDFETIPPRRRRDTDRVSPKRVSLGTALGLLGALAAAKPGLDLYASLTAAPTKIQELRAEVKEVEQKVETLRKERAVLLEQAETEREAMREEVRKLKRWKCVLGWDPGGVLRPHTLNGDRICPE